MSQSTEPQSTATITAGWFYRKTVREELERGRFLGFPLSWHEAKGRWSSEFTIKGPQRLLKRMVEAVNTHGGKQ